MFPTTVKYFEDGVMIGEFCDPQALHDFIVQRTKRKCEADFILSQRKRDRVIKRKAFINGVIAGQITIILVALTLALFGKR